MNPSDRPWRYVVAVVFAIAAALLKAMFGVHLVPSVYSGSYVAVLAAIWYGDLGPGLLCLAVSALLGAFFFLPATGMGVLRVILFLLVGGALSVVTATLLRRQREENARRTSDLQNALTTVKEGRERFHQAFECAPIGMALGSPDGTFQQVNEALCHLLDYSPEQLLGRPIECIIHPDHVERSRAERHRLLNGEIRIIQAAREFVTRSGGLVWAQVSVSVLRGRNGEPLHFIAQLEDLTARMRAEAEMRVSEAKFRALAETTTAAIFIYQGTLLIYVNPEAEAITGYTRDELLSMSFWDVIEPESQSLIRERGLARQRGENVPTRYEVMVRRKDGQIRWVDFNGARIEFDGGPAVLGTAFDVTERKRAEEAVRDREAELAHVLRVSTLGEMAAGLAHEINQPLAAIVNFAKGCSRRLDSDSFDPVSVRDAIDRIASEALRASEVIRRLRLMVRKDSPRRESTDLNDLVRDAVRLVEREARELNVKLAVRLVSIPVEVHVDGVQIEQVILNLLRNALDAIRDAPDGTRDLVLTVRNDRAVAELHVHDSGVGLPGDPERLFEPFFTTKSGGLGMGLTISRSIIEAHGGQLWARPHQEHGSEVSFTLPFADQVREYVH